MKISNITTRRKNNLNRNTRIYFFVDETLIENLENRRNRPYNEYRKLLPEVFEKLGIPANTKARWRQRSEEHTSELQSRGHLVCRLLLEKKNNSLSQHTP